MDPQFNKEPALRLPQPMPDGAAWQATPNTAHEQAPNFELGMQPPQGAPMAAVPALSTPPLQQFQQPLQVPPASTGSVQAATTVQANPNDLDDERVWVERAKRIVEQTHTDPYLESQEIGKFKAEYLKDVHAKNIKVAEG